VRQKDHNLERLEDANFADIVSSSYFTVASVCESNFRPREHAPRQARLAELRFGLHGVWTTRASTLQTHPQLELASTEGCELSGGDSGQPGTSRSSRVGGLANDELYAKIIRKELRTGLFSTARGRPVSASPQTEGAPVR
jgi:hypothetical protein